MFLDGLVLGREIADKKEGWSNIISPDMLRLVLYMAQNARLKNAHLPGFARACSDRTKGNGFKLKERLGLDWPLETNSSLQGW